MLLHKSGWHHLLKTGAKVICTSVWRLGAALLSSKKLRLVVLFSVWVLVGDFRFICSRC